MGSPKSLGSADDARIKRFKDPWAWSRFDGTDSVTGLSRSQKGSAFFLRPYRLSRT